LICIIGGKGMANLDKKLAQWKDAQVQCKLSHEAVKMAKEMGLNPLSLIKNIPNKSEQWKAPVEEWVRDMYEKRHAKNSRKQNNSSGQPNV
jgi:hypothetical protein